MIIPFVVCVFISRLFLVCMLPCCSVLLSCADCLVFDVLMYVYLCLFLSCCPCVCVVFVVVSSRADFDVCVRMSCLSVRVVCAFVSLFVSLCVYVSLVVCVFSLFCLFCVCLCCCVLVCLWCFFFGCLFIMCCFLVLVGFIC